MLNDVIIINDVIEQDMEQRTGRYIMWFAGPSVRLVHINCMLPCSKNYREITNS